jgi:hypothetical protein
MHYIAYAQDEWHVSPLATLNLGLRALYYTPLTETHDLQVKFNIDTGVIDPNTTRPYKTTKDSILPRLAFTFAPGKWVMRPASVCSSVPVRRKTRFSPWK